MWRFIAGLSADRNTEWAEKKNKTVPHVFSDSAKVYILVFAVIIDKMEQFKNNCGSNCAKTWE